MKTTKKSIEAAAPANGRPSAVSKTQQIQLHSLNRTLKTEDVLTSLRLKLPQLYNVAEVVGKWVWLEAVPTSKNTLSKKLWALGFHWNQRRHVWQHPCGMFDPIGSHPTDPRLKYRSFFPADQQPA